MSLPIDPSDLSSFEIRARSAESKLELLSRQAEEMEKMIQQLNQQQSKQTSKYNGKTIKCDTQNSFASFPSNSIINSSLLSRPSPSSSSSCSSSSSSSFLSSSGSPYVLISSTDYENLLNDLSELRLLIMNSDDEKRLLRLQLDKAKYRTNHLLKSLEEEENKNQGKIN